MRAWNDSPKPKEPPRLSKLELYQAEITAFANRLRVSNTDEFRRQLAEQHIAVCASSEAVRNKVYVQDGDASHFRIYHHPRREPKDILGWALRLLHPGKMMGVADAHFKEMAGVGLLK